MSVHPTVFSVVLGGLVAGAAHGQRLDPLPITEKDVRLMVATVELEGDSSGQGGLAGSCDTQVSSHTDADFGGAPVPLWYR